MSFSAGGPSYKRALAVLLEVAVRDEDDVDVAVAVAVAERVSVELPVTDDVLEPVLELLLDAVAEPVGVLDADELDVALADRVLDPDGDAGMQSEPRSTLRMLSVSQEACKRTVQGAHERSTSGGGGLRGDSGGDHWLWSSPSGENMSQAP